MSLKVNFAGVPDQKKFDPAPAGNYTLELADYVEDTVSQGDNEGAPLYKLTWEIQHEDESLQGKKVWDMLTIVDGSLWRLKAMLKAFGYDVPDDEDNQEEVDIDFDELLGKTVEARVSVSRSTDKKTGEKYPPKNKIARFLIPDEEGIE